MSIKRLLPYVWQAQRLRVLFQLDMVEAFSLGQGGDNAQFRLTQMQLDLLTEEEREAYFAQQRANAPEERKAG